MKRLLLGLVMAGSVTLSQAAELPRADPASVGLDPDRLAAITRLLKSDVDQHVLPGAVLLVARHGKVAYEEVVGSRDPQAPAPAARDDIYRIYSMSKPITVAAALMLVERGRIALDEPVSKYLPQFASMQVGVPDDSGGGMHLVPAERPMTIQDLMRHSAGLTYGFFGSSPVKTAYVQAHLNAGDPDNAAFVDRLAKLPLAYQPGTTWDYSYAIDVLGRVVEVVSGQALYQFEKENLLDPLGMTDTGFGVEDPSKQGRIAEPFANDRSFGVDADFSDPRHPVRMQSGGGGMVSTARDYARFLQMMLNGGTLDGRRYLGPQTVRFMASDQLGAVKPGPLYLPGPGYRFGLGVAVRTDAGVAPFPGSVGDWYWGGAGGTYMWVDPVQDMVVVFMMQSPKQRLHYRSVIRDLVNAAIVSDANGPTH
ncbi:MAG TPA: serine hydrolase domain-containing protein [Acetobacteraceae bacterium]